MTRYHVNPATGRTGKCEAQDSCPFGSDAPHSDTRAGAQRAYEAYVANDDDPETNELATFSKKKAKAPGSAEAMAEKLLGTGSVGNDMYAKLGNILEEGRAAEAANRKASEPLIGTSIGETNGGQPMGVPAYAPVSPTGIRALFGAEPKDPWDEEVERKYKEEIVPHRSEAEKEWLSMKLRGEELRAYIYKMQGEYSKYLLDGRKLRAERAKTAGGGSSYDNDARGKRMASWLNESRFLNIPYTRFDDRKNPVFMSDEQFQR